MSTTYINHLLPLTLALTVLLGYNFIGAQWANPPAGTPPANNVEAPINTSATSQLKEGALGTGPLSVTGNTLITSSNPSVQLDDSDGRKVWLWGNAGNFFILADRDGNKSTIEPPYPMTMLISDDSINDYVQFSNKVYASEYCDRNGGNCSTAAALAGSGAFYYNVATARSAGNNTVPDNPSLWPAGTSAVGPAYDLGSHDVVTNFTNANYEACFLTTSLTYARTDDNNTAAGGCVLTRINASTGAWRLTAKAQKRTVTECSASCMKF